MRHKLLLLGSAFVYLVLLIGGASASPAATTRVSVDSVGNQADSWSVSPAISADGRYVAFPSQASNLVTDDENGLEDLFVHDLETANTARVGVDSSGLEANRASASGDSPAISSDGRFVAFTSVATNLVVNDKNDREDVFLHDRETGETTLISVASDGSQGDWDSFNPAISADGRYVAFGSEALNLVLGDTNDDTDIFVRDRQTESTTRVSVASDGSQGDGASFAPAISADGRYVAFYSAASNLVPGDTNGTEDVFVHDRQTGQIERVSVASDGSEVSGNGLGSGLPAIDADGSVVAFTSNAPDLVARDMNGTYDVFVHDRDTGRTTRVSVASDGSKGNGSSYTPAISADGRHVAFRSGASNLVPGDANDVWDIFVHDRETGKTALVSVASSGSQANNFSHGTGISADGRYVVFSSQASNLVPEEDTNGTSDVFVHDSGSVPVGGIAEAPDASRPPNSRSNTWPAAGVGVAGAALLLVALLRQAAVERRQAAGQ